MGQIVSASVASEVIPGSWVSGTSANVFITWTTTVAGESDLKAKVLPLLDFDAMSGRGATQQGVTLHTYSPFGLKDEGVSYGYYPLTTDSDSGDPFLGTFGEHPSGTYTIPVTFIPHITDVVVSDITTDSAIFSWTVSGLFVSTDYVEYTLDGISQNSPSVMSNTENKQIILTGLSAGASYTYVINSTSGVGITQAFGAFGTLPLPPEPPHLGTQTTTAGPQEPVSDLLDPVELQEQYIRLAQVASRFMR